MKYCDHENLYVYGTYGNDDELDHLLENVKLIDNDKFNLHGSQIHVPLFATVRSPTNLPCSETGLAPGEGSDGVWRNGGGPCQQPAPAPKNMGLVA